MKLTNSLSGNKELFSPLNDGRVTMYVCGITPYDYAHVGHGRSAVAFDMVFRVLKFFGYKVAYCRNFTDIDDKLITRAEKELGSGLAYQQVAQRFITAYQHDIDQLLCLRPHHEPYVTHNIPEIITFVQGLIQAGKAYVVGQDVYYQISTCPQYGKLSKQKLDELRAGARVEVNDKKRDPLDFALWKSEKPGTFFESPWGWGRPGWHIECSALAAKYLDKHIDIHGGGMDLLFPHHENEIAQSEGLYGEPFVRYWLHNAFVRINKEKMSKSLGNFFTLRDVYQNINPVLLRFYFLNHHYRSPLDFAFEDIDSLHKTYQRLCRALGACIAQPVTPDVLATWDVGAKMLNFLQDDLNTTGLWGVVFEHLSDIEKNAEHASWLKYLIQEVLGLPLELLPEKEVAITPQIQELLTARQQARDAKDWAKSDAIRDELKRLGYEVRDKKQ